MKLLEIFEELPDFRRKSQVRHNLSSILVISLCAVLSGADDFEEIAEYGKEKEGFLGQFLSLPYGIPSHDTIRRVFQNMDTSSFEKCLRARSEEVIKGLKEYQINIDGKVLRATGERGKKTAAICIVSAWSSEHCLSLGQVKVDKKSNEKTAIPELLEAIDLQGALVSIDAMGCDKKIAATIRSKEGDYLLALKKNQKGLYEARHWKDSKRVIMVESERSFKNGKEKTTFQTRFYISSKEQDAQYFSKQTRKHWSIENQLHWYLDVVFNEDRQRVREGNAPENMAIIRKLALQTLIKSKGKKSVKTMRKKIAWKEDLLFEVLQYF